MADHIYTQRVQEHRRVGERSGVLATPRVLSEEPGRGSLVRLREAGRGGACRTESAMKFDFVTAPPSLFRWFPPYPPRIRHASESLERQARAPLSAHQGKPARTGQARAPGREDCCARRQQRAGATRRVGGGQRLVAQRHAGRPARRPALASRTVERCCSFAPRPGSAA